MKSLWPFNKSESQHCTETVQHDIGYPVDNDDKKSSPTAEQNIKLTANHSLDQLRERAKHVENLAASLGAIKNKQNVDSLDSEAKTVGEKSEDPVVTSSAVKVPNENQQIEELAVKMEANSKVIQSLQDAVQALCLKVSNLTDILDARKPAKGTAASVTAEESNDCTVEQLPNQLLDANGLPTTSETENPSSHSIRLANGKNTVSPSNETVKPVSKKKIKIGKGPKESKKNPLKTKRNKEPEKKIKSRLTDSDESVNESYETAVQNCGGNDAAANANHDAGSDGCNPTAVIGKPDGENEKPILNSLSKLEFKLANKMNENDDKIESIMCNLDKLIATVDDLKQKTNADDLKQSINADDADAFKVDCAGSRSKRSQTAEDANKKNAVLCGNERCVCNLIGEKKIGKKKSEKHDADGFMLCQFLKCLGEKVGRCSAKNDDDVAPAVPPAGGSREPTKRYRDKTTQCSMALIDERKKSTSSNCFPEPTVRGQNREDSALKKRDKTTQYSPVNVAKNKSDVSNGFPKPIIACKQLPDCPGRAEKLKDKGNDPCSTPLQRVDDDDFKYYTPRYLKKCGCFSKEKDGNRPNSTFISNCVAAHQCNFPKFT